MADTKRMDFFDDNGIGELVLDDDELVEADDEDNVSLDFGSGSDDDDISLTGVKPGDQGDDEPEF